MSKRFLLLLLLTITGNARSDIRNITGEVKNGETFQREVGSGLIFRLNPSDTGWMISIVPKAHCDQDDDWASVANAPFRGYNSLFVDASYGNTAKEAAEWRPRDFVFVQTCSDYKQESARLGIVMWGNHASRKEYDEALAKLGASRMGKGRFTILKSKVSPSGELNEGKDYGKIDYLRFRVDLHTTGVLNK